ncbi:MAG: DNA-binding transcriptional regulator, partial [Sedimentisphaerales bacterium]|nr:DNA-binding transcriptional regulator [Sedimentisphaerales bacterium]
SLPNIISDNVAIGKMAAEHLLYCGFQRFAFCGFAHIDWSLERKESFSKTIKEAGFKTYFYDRPRAKFRLSWENEYVLMANWLKSLTKPVGLMACNDDHNRHVLEACKIAGLQVPEQVAIVGVDNDDLVCELSAPPLSSIALNTERAGYEAAELLDKLMTGIKMDDQNIIARPTHVVVRQSSNIFVMEDREIVEALRFIRRHSKKSLQVGDVAEAVLMSRRSLEKRFRKVLKSSILEEIRRVRVEQVCQLLVSTNLPVSQIASTLRYSSTGNLIRYFRKEKRMTPLAYRKQYGYK